MANYLSPYLAKIQFVYGVHMEQVKAHLHSYYPSYLSSQPIYLAQLERQDYLRAQLIGS